jgi:hypothetical protein
MKALKIVSAIVYSIFTAFLVMIFLVALPDLITSEDGWAALGGVVLMVYTTIGCLVYLAPIILSIVGLRKNKNVLEEKPHKKNKRYFVFMIVLPIVTTIINFLSYYIVLTN